MSEQQTLKRTYDAAAEALCMHIKRCSRCTMQAVGCAVGRRVADAEDDAWQAYRRATQPSRREPAS